MNEEGGGGGINTKKPCLNLSDFKTISNLLEICTKASPAILTELARGGEFDTIFIAHSKLISQKYNV